MMYNQTVDFIEGYIKHTLSDANFPVYDAKFSFTEPADYSSFYIMPFISDSPFKNEFSTSSDAELNNKTVDYLESGTIQIKVDFRGDTSFEKMATFKNSFFMQKNRDFLKDAGFGFMGFTVSPDVITNLNSTSVSQGMTATVKFSTSEIISDTNTIVKDFSVKSQLVKELNNEK